MPMTNSQFKKKVLSASGRKIQDDAEDSETILILLNAAYGVYAKDVNSKKVALNKDISDLRVNLEEKNTEVVREQGRTAIALTLNHASIKKIGSFMTTPISNWGKKTNNIFLENNDNNIVVDQENSEDLLDSETSILVEEVEASKDKPKKIYEESEGLIKDLPWFVRIPTIALSKVFGQMTPLVAAVLIISTITGAILYGQHSRNVWESKYEAEKVSTGQLTNIISGHERELEKYALLKRDYEKQSVENRNLTKDILSLNEQLSDANEKYSNAIDNHQKEKDELNARHVKELSDYAKNAGLAEEARSNKLQAEISRLEKNIGAYEKEKIIFNERIKNLSSNYSSSSASEKSLQESNDTLFKKNTELTRQVNQLRTETSKIAGLLLRTSQALGAVDNYFWAKNGYLVVRRACFRNFYLDLFSDQDVKKEAEKRGIPLDMVSAIYNVASDPDRRLKNCHKYYGS